MAPGVYVLLMLALIAVIFGILIHYLDATDEVGSPTSVIPDSHAGNLFVRTLHYPVKLDCVSHALYKAELAYLDP